MYCLYIHTNKINGKRYVGITGYSNPKRRWGVNGCKYDSSPRFLNAIKKYGWDNFEHEIRLTNLTKEEAKERERFYISLFRTTDDRFGYNISKGGESNDQGKKSGSPEYDRNRYANNPELRMKKKALAKAYYESHKEQKKEYSKEYRNTSQSKEQHRRYYQEHKSERSEYMKQYWQEHKDELKEHMKQYRLEHLEEEREAHRRYEERKKLRKLNAS